MSNNFLYQLKELFRKVEQLYDKIPLGVQIYPQIATIVAVNDPDDKGRVKVTYDNAPNEISEWIEVVGIHSGNLPAQYIGSRMLAVFLNGNAEDAVLIGSLLTDLDLPVMTSPVTVPMIDEQTSDDELACNESTQGSLVLFSNTVSSDLRICIRRNTTTTNSEEPQTLKSIYSWKSLTNSLALLEGEYGGPGFGDVSSRKGIRACTPELEGEMGIFSEDRSLRQTQMICRKMPGGKYAWININSPMIYTRTLLPQCIEESHGLEVIVDDGLNSELAICIRRNKEMVWETGVVKKLGFHPSQPPKPAEVSEFTQNESAELPDKNVISKLSSIDFVAAGEALKSLDFSTFGGAVNSVKSVVNLARDIFF
jgi:hypothetical protein